METIIRLDPTDKTTEVEDKINNARWSLEEAFKERDKKRVFKASAILLNYLKQYDKQKDIPTIE